MLTAPSVVFATAPASRPSDMKQSVPTTRSGIAADQEPVSCRPNAAAPRPRKIAICTSATSDRDRDPRAPTTVPVETGDSWSRRSSLAVAPALEGRGRSEGGAHRHRPAQQAGRHELDRVERLVLDALGAEGYVGGSPLARLVGAVDERARACPGPSRPAPGRSACSARRASSPSLLHGHVRVALAHLASSASAGRRCGSRRRTCRRPRGRPSACSVNERDVPDLDQVELGDWSWS